MKQIAILSYEIMFDPSEAWSNGYEFENALADFFVAHGFDAHIVEAKGGTGKRVILLEKIEQLPMPQETKPQPDLRQQVRKIAAKEPPKSFKQFGQRAIPYNLMREKKVPKLEYQRPGITNRMKVRVNG